MSRALLTQARNVVRLRDIRFDTAVQSFETALAEFRDAETGLAQAEAAHAAAVEALEAARRALSEQPECAQARLALIDAAAAELVACEDSREAARRRLTETEHQLEAARSAMLAARARRDAMSNRAGAIASGIARQDEEAAAIEMEERVSVSAGED